MADDDTRMDLIRRYLLGQLSSTEHADFQTRLLLEPELRQEVQMMRAAQKVLRTTGTGKDARGRWLMRLLLVLGVIAVIQGGVYLYWNRSKNAALPDTPPDSNTPAREKTQRPIDPNKTIKATPLDRPVSSTPKPVAAEFRPNPALERYIGGNGGLLRGSDAGLVLRRPRSGTRFTTNGRTTSIRISGSVKTGALPLRAHLFKNDPAAYTGFKPEWSADLPLLSAETDKGQFSFEAVASVVATPGLYYLLLENADSGAVLQVVSIHIIPAK